MTSRRPRTLPIWRTCDLIHARRQAEGAGLNVSRPRPCLCMFLSPEHWSTCIMQTKLTLVVLAERPCKQGNGCKCEVNMAMALLHARTATHAHGQEPPVQIEDY